MFFCDLFIVKIRRSLGAVPVTLSTATRKNQKSKPVYQARSQGNDGYLYHTPS